MTDDLISERRGDVLVLTINRPDRMNAATLSLADEMSAALDRLDGARCVLLTGAGRAFCAGADLTARGQITGSPGEASERSLRHHYNPLILRLTALDVPVVSAVNGAAAGIGCSLALAADIVVAGRSAYFLQAFVNIGLVPDGGSTWMLPRLVGTARAKAMMMLGERIAAEQAEDWGLIHRCVEDDTLMAEAMALAQRLANGPTLALGQMRRLVAGSLDGTLAEGLAAEAAAQRAAADSADAAEGGLAFLSKRPPHFTGR